ncbi:beta-lactamase-like protein [Mycena amicta]|nr:beta-lactamase-like protein [Mycena amicta]
MLSLSLFLAALCALVSASFRDFGIPASHSTVSVKRIHVGSITLTDILPIVFHPVLPGFEALTFPMYAFLVEHGKRRVLFDLGMRKDTENLAPAAQAFFASGAFKSDIKQDLVQQLEEGGVALESIESVIWSHAHFDHTGDMSKFPNSTTLLIGSETNVSTYPANPDSFIQESDLAGRTLSKIDFSSANLTFNGLKAIDYFGDGSFYLLDTPGHLPGHLTALARVTRSSFIVLGGDSFHHGGQLRPRPAFQQRFPCPAHILDSSHHAVSTEYFWSPHSTLENFDLPSRASPLLAIPDIPGSFYADPVQAGVSLDKLAGFDADADFLLLPAHDMSVLGNETLPYFPAALDGWKDHGAKEKTVWSFLEEDSDGFVFRPRA